MSESTPETTPEATPDTEVNVGGDAVINQAEDGGGVDHAAPEADAQPADTQTNGSDTE